MTSRTLIQIAAGIVILLLFASAISQGIQDQNDKLSLESRVAALETKVKELEQKIDNPQVKILPLNNAE